MTPERYTSAVESIRGHIGDGSVYQANLTVPLTFRTEASPTSLYARLRRSQPSPYAALVRGGGRRLVSLSPELFFRIESRTILARPMKGTAPRNTDGAALAADPKNRAENLMIVDLLRNDLSRVSVPGSVRVPALFQLEAYPTVWQMTSTIQATLTPQARLSDAFQALFPCGSVTGAPKIRAMEIIREEESGPRGVYCGAIGYAGPDGSAAFSVPIRTIELAQAGTEWNGSLGLGSGIVWDSRAEDEYEECLLKGRFLVDDVAPSGTA
jgi:para-aminobenzoate synthetase/4-amino-4-deoxychorismate lyase